MCKALLFEIREILSVYGLEEFTEMRNILEAQVISDLLHAHVGIGRPAFGLEHDPLADMIAGGIARDLLYDLVEIIGRHGELAGIVLHQLPGHVSLFHQGDEVLDEPYVPGLYRDLHGAVELACQIDEEDAGVSPDDLGL